MIDFKYFSKVKRVIFLVTLVFAIPCIVVAEGKKPFNAGDVIIEHVNDSHSWHVAGDITIPLPIIVYSKAHGLSIFSSSKLEDSATYDGYRLNGQHIVANDGSELIDLSLTKNATTIVLTGIFLLLMMPAVSKAYRRRGMQSPKGVQSLFEPIIVFIRDDVALNCIGKKRYEQFMPYLLTLFFFIVIMNLLGLVPFFPGGANVMGNIGVTMTLAIFTFVLMLFYSQKYFWKHTFWMPGLPLWVRPLLILIEILGIFLKPFTLMIRIFANILAGHIVALSFFSLIFIFGAMNIYGGYGVSIVSVAFTVAMLLLDLLIGIIQAYVFTLLSAIYFGMVTEAPHHSKYDQ